MASFLAPELRTLLTVPFFLQELLFGTVILDFLRQNSMNLTERHLEVEIAGIDQNTHCSQCSRISHYILILYMTIFYCHNKKSLFYMYDKMDIDQMDI
ncbi:unnamed protein product [Rhizophagus irregularis]|nr:unnamed protein product [Rhizophagus irregularis]